MFYTKLDAPFDFPPRGQVVISGQFSQEVSHLVHSEVGGLLLVLSQSGLVDCSHLIEIIFRFSLVVS